MKICNKCKIEKQINDFCHRKDGKIVHECKSCTAKRSREHYEKNKSLYNERRKKYYLENKEKELKRCKEYYYKNHKEIRLKVNESNKDPEKREKARIRGKEWAKKNPEKHSIHATKHRKKYPERYKARQWIFWAVKMGFVKVEKFCELCGNETKLQAHHRDYSKPLEVNWLCKLCHIKEHDKERKCLP